MNSVRNWRVLHYSKTEIKVSKASISDLIGGNLNLFTIRVQYAFFLKLAIHWLNFGWFLMTCAKLMQWLALSAPIFPSKNQRSLSDNSWFPAHCILTAITGYRDTIASAGNSSIDTVYHGYRNLLLYGQLTIANLLVVQLHFLKCPLRKMTHFF